MRYAPSYTNLDVVWQEMENHIRALTEVRQTCPCMHVLGTMMVVRVASWSHTALIGVHIAALCVPLQWLQDTHKVMGAL